MHQNDRLQAPDTAAFERTVDQALSSPEIRAALARTAGPFTAEQLRSAALRARDALAATAAAEHRELARLRAAAADGTLPVPRRAGTASRSGGVLPALGVLVPGLAAIAATVFLVIGFGLRAVAEPSRLADELVTAGWTSAAVACIAGLAGLGWLLVAASRNRAAGAGSPAEAAPEVVRAHEAWQLALLERGIMPFLLGRLDAAADAEDTVRPALPRPAGAGAAGGTGPARPAPDDDPGFGSPDFSSPDFGRPGFSGPTAPGAP
ncbi:MULTISPECIES: hypothetical protein [unclassified Streptomyces]|uniref:hypothetical protein n=1 Tax=unclassified Streptomyces TaxID=2593676 RepID=UPI00036992B4|nr:MULTISPECIES: hypothetical protein [unclassified Streptomyces]MYT27695.1 hypothetical protein [Streptomyces sp. SID8354]